MKLIPPTPERVRPARESLHWRESLARIVQEGLTVLHSQLAAPLRATEAAEGEHLYRAGQGLQEETGLPGQPAPERPPGAGRPLFRRVQAWWDRVKAWCRAAVGLSAHRTTMEAWVPRVDHRLEGLESRLDSVDERLGRLERDVSGLKQDMAAVKSRLDSVQKNVSDMRSEVKGPEFEKRVRRAMGNWFWYWVQAHAGAQSPIRTTVMIHDQENAALRREFLDTYCAGTVPEPPGHDPTLADAVLRVEWPGGALFVVAEFSLQLDGGDRDRVRDRSAWLRRHLDPPAPVIPCLLGPAVWEGLPPLLAEARIPWLRTETESRAEWQAQPGFDDHARAWLHRDRQRTDDSA